MRKIIFGGAMSLDGYIAGPNGEYDWIAMDPEIDFSALMARHDTYLVGRKTYDAMRSMGGGAAMPGSRTFVCSRTLPAGDRDGVTVCPDAVAVATRLRGEPGKDIAIFGGGDLFRSLAGAGLVDGVEVSLIPVLLGGGIPLLPPPAGRIALELTGHKVYKATGTVHLEYAVVRP